MNPFEMFAIEIYDPLKVLHWMQLLSSGLWLKLCYENKGI